MSVISNKNHFSEHDITKQKINVKKAMYFIFSNFYIGTTWFMIRFFYVIIKISILIFERGEILDMSFVPTDINEFSATISLKNYISPINIYFEATEIKLYSLNDKRNKSFLFCLKIPEFEILKNESIKFQKKIKISDCNNKNFISAEESKSYLIKAKLNFLPRISFLKFPFSIYLSYEMIKPKRCKIKWFIKEIDITETKDNLNLKIELDTSFFELPEYINVSFNKTVFYLTVNKFNFKLKIGFFEIKKGKFFSSSSFHLYIKKCELLMLKDLGIDFVLKNEVLFKLFKYEILGKDNQTLCCKDNLNNKMELNYDKYSNIIANFKKISCEREINYLIEDIEDPNNYIYLIKIEKQFIPCITNKTTIKYEQFSIDTLMFLNGYEFLKFRVEPENDQKFIGFKLVVIVVGEEKNKLDLLMPSNNSISLKFYGENGLSLIFNGLIFEYNNIECLKIINSKNVYFLHFTKFRETMNNYLFSINHTIENFNDMKMIKILSSIIINKCESNFLKLILKIFSNLSFTINFSSVDFLITFNEMNAQSSKLSYKIDDTCISMVTLINMYLDNNRKNLVEALVGNGSYVIKMKKGNILIGGRINTNLKKEGEKFFNFFKHKIKHCKSVGLANHSFIMNMEDPLLINDYKCLIKNQFVLPNIKLCIKPTLDNEEALCCTNYICFTNIHLVYLFEKHRSILAFEHPMRIDIYAANFFKLYSKLLQSFKFSSFYENDTASDYIASFLNFMKKLDKQVPKMIDKMLNINMNFSKHNFFSFQKKFDCYGLITIDISKLFFGSINFFFLFPKIKFKIVDDDGIGRKKTIFIFIIKISENFENYKVKIKICSNIKKFLATKHLVLVLNIEDSEYIAKFLTFEIISFLKQYLIMMRVSDKEKMCKIINKISVYNKSIEIKKISNAFIYKGCIIFELEKIINILKKILVKLLLKLKLSNIPSGINLSFKASKVIFFKVGTFCNDVSNTHIIFDLLDLEMQTKIIFFETKNIKKGLENNKTNRCIEVFRKNNTKENNLVFNFIIEVKFPDYANLNINNLEIKTPVNTFFLNNSKLNRLKKPMFDQLFEKLKRMKIFLDKNKIKIMLPKQLSVHFEFNLKFSFYYSKSRSACEDYIFLYEIYLIPVVNYHENALILNYNINLKNCFRVILYGLSSIIQRNNRPFQGVLKIVVKDGHDNQIFLVMKNLYNINYYTTNLLSKLFKNFYNKCKMQIYDLIDKTKKEFKDFFIN